MRHKALWLVCLLLICTQSALAESLGQRAFDYGNWIFYHATDVEYRHNKVPAERQIRVMHTDERCLAKTDCSGFVSCVLDYVAPEHYRPIHHLQPRAPYPQAKTYAAFFASLPADGIKHGWKRINSVFDLKQGDVIAWKKPAHEDDHGGGGNTGHVMFVAKGPEAAQTLDTPDGKLRYVSIRVLDSSSVSHFPPELLPPDAQQTRRDGIGKGYVRIVLGEKDRPIGYWEGTYWGEGEKEIKKPTMSHDIHFARLVSNEE